MRALIPVVMLTFACSAYAQDGWRLETPSAQWDERSRHNAVTFDNEIWVLQGDAGVAGFRNDAWSSGDGINWTERVAPLPWAITSHATTVVFDNRMWVLGGDHGGNFSSQVWHTVDGVNWSQEPDAPWLERRSFAAVVFNGRLWVFGGWTKQPTYQSYLNDVWSTTDGINWTQEVAAANWSARNGHTAAVFNNRMWVMGGGDNQGFTNDVWSSSDGVNWVQETANALWGPRGIHATVVYRDRLWVIGGFWGDGVSTIYYDDIWSSADGVNWVQETGDAPWGEGDRRAQAVTVFNDRIWLAGGGTTTPGHMDDVWSYGLHIAPDVLPDAEEDQSYSADFEAREGDGPFDWSLSSGQLPAGLTLDTSTTSDTTQLSGAPTEDGEYDFTIRLEDTDGNTIEQEYTLTVNPPPPIGDDGNGADTGCTAGAGGLPWLILYGALTLTGAVILRRRALGA